MSPPDHIESIWDAEKKVLKMSFRGKITVGLLEDSVAPFQAVLGQVEPGFTLLTDLNELGSMDPGCTSTISRIMDQLGKSGVDRIVRVIPKTSQDIGFNIMSLFHYRRGIRIIVCETLAEAERALT